MPHTHTMSREQIDLAVAEYAKKHLGVTANHIDLRYIVSMHSDLSAELTSVTVVEKDKPREGHEPSD